jgi:hypothetical protein
MANGTSEWREPLQVILPLLISSILAIVLLYLAALWVIEAPPATYVRVVKWLSLWSMNWVAAYSNAVIKEKFPGAGERITGHYRWVRRVITVIILVLSVSLASELGWLPADVPQTLSPKAQEFLGLASKEYHEIPESIRSFLPDLIILGVPIGCYVIANILCMRDTYIPGDVRRHVQNVFYFVSLPSLASIIAFFIIAGTILNLGRSTDQVIFVAGATALLIFISNAMTICVDGHARSTIYRETGWLVPTLRPPHRSVLIFSLILGTLALVGQAFGLYGLFVSLPGYLVLVWGCISFETRRVAEPGSPQPLGGRWYLRVPNRWFFVLSLLFAVVAVSNLYDRGPITGAVSYWLVLLAYLILFLGCLSRESQAEPPAGGIATSRDRP